MKLCIKDGQASVPVLVPAFPLGERNQRVIHDLMQERQEELSSCPQHYLSTRR
jgi:hypothetical protein